MFCQYHHVSHDNKVSPFRRTPCFPSIYRIWNFSKMLRLQRHKINLSDANRPTATLISSPHLAIAFLLQVILFLHVLRNRLWSFVLVLRLGIVLCLILLLRCYDFSLSLYRWVLIFPLLYWSIVTIKQVTIIWIILSFMSIPSIRKLIAFHWRFLL